MPGKKKKYNVCFPPSRIKKIMQKDPEVGRIAKAVPVVISRVLEMFIKSLLLKTCLITESKSSGTMSVSHMMQCIESESLFHFLKDLAEQAVLKAQKDNRSQSLWPLYRSKLHEISVKKSSDVGTRQRMDSLDQDSSSSEAELFICL
ncbi:dr1-associated corepressor isoform X1 [Synchiropus splendidus]|uniref:dr1-associated corepressor isoform X1 n=2 Tax=Synchiropus splendidus TaxID=270530 RepID=UPI00237E1E4C|nr:dr1-associated corepressor isoform X1 [Synchiropus splendidus]